MPQVFQVDQSDVLEPYSYERSALAADGVDLVIGNCANEAELLARGGDADVLWLAWQPRITADVLAALPRCRLVVRWGVGFDQIDTEAATAQGVAVANAPTYGTGDVAEHAVALLLASARWVARVSASMHRGEWSVPGTQAIHRVGGRTLGLLGVGRIGAGVAARARGLGLRVIGYDAVRSFDELRDAGVEPVELDRLLGSSDFVSIHVPLTPATRHLVDAAFLARMKSGCVLINTSRGSIVDEAALVGALESGHLSGAALDVFEQEPLAADSPLRSLEQVVLTPHMAAVSAEAWADLRAEMCRTTLEFLRSGWCSTVVNPRVRSRLRRPVATATD